MRVLATAAAVGLGLVLSAADARACGAAYPGGPMVCTMEDSPAYRKAHPPIRARIGISWSYTTTTILFGSARRADLQRHVVFAGTELPLGNGYGLRFGAGGIVDGQLTPTHVPFRGSATFAPGVSAYIGIGKTIVDEGEIRPFVQLGLNISGARAATRGPSPNEAPSFTAFDARGAATVGKTFGGWLVPYVGARAFGGPIYYHYAGAKVTGTDLYKYQVVGGVAVALRARGLDAFVEGVPLGERGLSAGLGVSF